MEEVDDVNFPPPGAHKTRSIEWLVSNAGASGRNSWLGATGEKLTGGGAGAGGGGGGGAASSSIISGLSSTHGGSSGAAGGGGGGGRRRSVAPIDGGGRARRLSTIHISTGHDISTGSSPKHARSRRGSSVHWADGTAGVEGGAGGAEFAEPPSSPMRKAKRVVDMFSSYKAIRGSQSAAKKTLLRAVNKISQQKWDKDASTVAFYSSCKYCASELLRVQTSGITEEEMKRTTCRFCRQFLVHQGKQDLKSLSRTGAVKDDSKIYPFSNPNSASAIRQDVEESMRLRRRRDHARRLREREEEGRKEVARQIQARKEERERLERERDDRMVSAISGAADGAGLVDLSGASEESASREAIRAKRMQVRRSSMVASSPKGEDGPLTAPRDVPGLPRIYALNLILKNSGCLHVLSEDEWGEVLSLSKHREYPPGWTVCAQGDEEKSIIGVTVGLITYDERGLSEGDVTGEVGTLLGGGRKWANDLVTGAEGCQCIEIPRDVLEYALRRRPTAISKMRTIVANISNLQGVFNPVTQGRNPKKASNPSFPAGDQVAAEGNAIHSHEGDSSGGWAVHAVDAEHGDEPLGDAAAPPSSGDATLGEGAHLLPSIGEVAAKNGVSSGTGATKKRQPTTDLPSPAVPSPAKATPGKSPAKNPKSPAKTPSASLGERGASSSSSRPAPARTSSSPKKQSSEKASSPPAPGSGGAPRPAPATTRPGTTTPPAAAAAAATTTKTTTATATTAAHAKQMQHDPLRKPRSSSSPPPSASAKAEPRNDNRNSGPDQPSRTPSSRPTSPPYEGNPSSNSASPSRRTPHKPRTPHGVPPGSGGLNAGDAWEYSWEVDGAGFPLPDGQATILRVASGDMPNASGGAPNYNDASSSHSFTRTRSNSPPKIRVLSGRSVSPPKMGSGGRRSSGEGRRGGGSAGGGTRLISDIREPAFGGAGGRPTTSDASWRGGGGAKVALMNRHLDDQTTFGNEGGGHVPWQGVEDGTAEDGHETAQDIARRRGWHTAHGNSRSVSPGGRAYTLVSAPPPPTAESRGIYSPPRELRRAKTSLGMVYGGEEGGGRGEEEEEEEGERGGGSRWVEYTGVRKGWWKRVPWSIDFETYPKWRRPWNENSSQISQSPSSSNPTSLQRHPANFSSTPPPRSLSSREMRHVVDDVFSSFGGVGVALAARRPSQKGLAGLHFPGVERGEEGVAVVKIPGLVKQGSRDDVRSWGGDGQSRSSTAGAMMFSERGGRSSGGGGEEEEKEEENGGEEPEKEEKEGQGN